MLTSIRIQNFRSIRDASVKLGQVNLFIGPNNSGKSNFLKGIGLLSAIVENYPERADIKHYHFSSMVNRPKDGLPLPQSINFSFKLSSEESQEHFFSFANSRPAILGDNFIPLATQVDKSSPEHREEAQTYVRSFYKEINDSRELLKGTIIYRLDPSRFKLSSIITPEYKLSQDGSNIVSFLFNLNQNHRKQYQRLEKDFARCLSDLVSISTPVVAVRAEKTDDKAGEVKPSVFKLKFFDQEDVGFWAEEVSEGVLYFLALLCIVHQPYPPKLLLLEEPEKGIHPRRIKEVMDFVFELARLRDIQVIITSHSPYVVDHFSDIPECISVFDRENGETVIHNAADLIAKTNEEYAAQGLPPTSYKDSLGEYWVSGFLGGVPL